MIEWHRAMRETFGPIPDDYLVVDVETSGLKHDQDVILQIGWCEVENRQVVDNDAVVLNWFDNSVRLPDPRWLRERINQTRAVMTREGNAYPWTEPVLRAGEKPLVALAELLLRLRSHALPAIVTHNGWMFDAPMIENHFKRYLSTPFEFAERRMWDTGALEKGVQLNMRPLPNDTLRSYSRRVMAKICRIKWALTKHCIPKYQLDKRFGLNVQDAHRADFDTRATHCLLQVFREQMEESTKETSCQSSCASETRILTSNT